jgi:AcrR family transcriptional regulator
MARLKTGNKATDLLRAATKIVAERGVGASTSSIAKAAGVGEGTLFRYYANKDILLNALYLDLKNDLRRTVAEGFPNESPLYKRVQHIWNSYIAWGMESPAKRQVMAQLAVSERITAKSRRDGLATFQDAVDAMAELNARGKFSNLSAEFASALLTSMAESTISAMGAHPREAIQYRDVGFEAFWSACGK